MRRVRLQHREPSEENRFKCDRAVRVALTPSRIGLLAFAPLLEEGRGHLPTGPALIVSNHVSLLDPFFTIVAAKRTIHYLATQAAMQDPVLGRILFTFGSVPKKKFVADATAIRQLKKWADLGGLVGTYPEGERSWDGELLPLLPGVEALVRLLKIPVVPVRVLNADRVMPRWAEQRRYGRVKIEFDQPQAFDRKDSPEKVREWIRAKLTIDQRDERNHFPVLSIGDLARGLENPLYRCPSCFAWDSLIPSGNEIRCGECLGTWRVDTQNVMHSQARRADTMTIVEARRRIHARVHEVPFVVDEHRFERAGIIAESERASVLDVTGDESKPIGEGRLVLARTSLRLVDANGQPTIDLPLPDLVNANVELRRRLTFRTKDNTVYEVVLPKESPLKWAELVEHWRMKAG